MIKASHNLLYDWFFRNYSRLMVHWHFRKMYIEGDIQTPEASLLIVSNHFSWWDGLFMYHLNHHLWKKKFHALMLEEQLSTRKFLSRLGCFSIRSDRSDIFESFRYAQNILRNPENVLLMYPQGRIHSQMERPVRFEPGAEHLFRATGANIKMVVVLTDYFSFRKPSVSFYIKDYMKDKFNNKSLNDAFNDFMNECVEKQNQKAETQI